MTTTLRQIDELSADQFENLTYDILQSAGMRQLVWRTPGADGGRDIEGQVYRKDFSGYEEIQRWYIECKRYKASIDWPTIWSKISFGDANNADYLLIVTNSNPSPQCESAIKKWNVGHRMPSVRVWRGYELDHLLNIYPLVGAKYGLRDMKFSGIREIQSLGLEISKISQSAYASYKFGGDFIGGLEASATLSELFAKRIDDIAFYGKFARNHFAKNPALFEWVDFDTHSYETDELALRAICATLRYITQSQRMKVSFSEAGFTLSCISPKHNVLGAAYDLLSLVSLWGDLDLREEGAVDLSVCLSFLYRSRESLGVKNGE
ncbi:MAG: hypothetical protein GVY13_11755 [Alphaproteobacteria bacterium]|jgi:hypothetical protein|nr:hypothetical protein [Alphaproteobacteria bacterium]